MGWGLSVWAALVARMPQETGREQVARRASPTSCHAERSSVAYAHAELRRPTQPTSNLSPCAFLTSPNSQDTRPPKDTFVNVRGLKDSGEVILSYGRATVLVGTTISLPAEEAEPLLRDGTVEMVDWDDGFGRNCS